MRTLGEDPVQGVQGRRKRPFCVEEIPEIRRSEVLLQERGPLNFSEDPTVQT